MLALWRHYLKVSLDALHQLGDVVDGSRHDDPRVRAPVLLPLKVEGNEIDRIEGQQRASVIRREDQLVFIRNALVRTTSFLAGEHIETTTAECRGESCVDVLVREQTGAYADHCVLDAISSA